MIHIDYTNDESKDIYPVIRRIVKCRDNFGDALGSETRYRRTTSTIAISRETTPTHVQRKEIADILLLRAQ